jgi:hypothetical protein
MVTEPEENLTDVDGLRANRGRKVSDAALQRALRAADGILANAAKELGVSRQLVWARVHRSSDLQEVIREIEDGLKDVAEGHIAAGVRRGDYRWVTYYMERKGADRGYGKDVGRMTDGDLEAIVASLGGDLDKLKAARAALDALSC